MALDYIQFEAMKNKSAMKTFVHVFWWTTALISLLYT